MKARKSNLLLMLNQQSTTNKERKMTEETKNNSRDRKFAFYKTTNDVTGDTTIVKATSVATAEAHAKKEALKKIASFTTVKLDADSIVELATNGFDLKSVVVIEAASKKSVKADESVPEAASNYAAVPAAPADAEPAAPATAPAVFSAGTFAR